MSFNKMSLFQCTESVLSLNNMQEIPPITPERWISNLVGAAREIADRPKQETRWLASDAYAWEHPYELICVVDDCVLDGFIEAFESTFNPEQLASIRQFRDELDKYCAESPQTLDPAQVLTDPQWENVRQRASAFVRAFKDRWPAPDSTNEANTLLQTWMKAYAEKENSNK